MMKQRIMATNTRTLAGRISALAILPILALSLIACGGDTPAAAPQPSISATATLGAQGGSTSATTVVSGTATAPVEQPTEAGGGDLMDLMTIGDPCALLTKQEVESILGPVAYKDEDSVRTPMRLACDFVLPDSTGGTHLSIALESPMNWVGVTTMNEGGEKVEGIGDDAYAYDADNERQLWVLVRGKAIVNVVLYPTDLEKAKQLASKIIEKLP